MYCFENGGSVSKFTKYVLKSLNYFIITMVVVFALLMVGVKLFEIDIYTVLSGSMEPEYKVGSLIYVVDANIDKLKENDVITFKIDKNVVATHRIVEIGIDEKNNRFFYTKGDANENRDEKVVEGKNIIGKPIFTIPYLGYVANFIQTKVGLFVVGGIGILLLVVVMFIDSITDDKKKVVKDSD